MTTMPIGEVSRRTGLSQSAIRYYETERLLPTAQRRSGWRAFEPDVVDRLRVIRMARELGFSLEEIRTLLNGFSPETPPSERWQHLARRKVPELEELERRVAAMKRLLNKGLRCHCVSVQDCVLYDCNPPVTIGRRKQD